MKRPLLNVCKKIYNLKDWPYFVLTEGGRVSEYGERLVIKNWEAVKNSNDFISLAHIQRYEWVQTKLGGLNCLDAGCGSGYGTCYLAERSGGNFIGVDKSERAINFANKKYQLPNLEYIQMDVRDLVFFPDTFDTILSFDVVEHLNERDQLRFFSELLRVLTSNGVLYVGCPNAGEGNIPFHLHELLYDELRALVSYYFEEVEIFGQVIVNYDKRKLLPGRKLVGFSYKNLMVQNLEDNVQSNKKAFGLLAVCRGPKKL